MSNSANGNGLISLRPAVKSYNDFALKSGDKIVLIGDSITDCGRLEQVPPFGNGYVSIVVNLANAKYPERVIEWVNKGISGDTVDGLASRWSVDVIQERPDWISVAIGINDVARDSESEKEPSKALGDLEITGKSSIRLRGYRHASSCPKPSTSQKRTGP